MVWAKILCLLLYGLAVAGCTGVWSGDAASAIQAVVILILAVHAFEVLIAFRYVRLYRGRLATSVLLTLLFGLLHLRPLQRQARRAAQVSATGSDKGVMER